jgi:hypothetical protein
MVAGCRYEILKLVEYAQIDLLRQIKLCLPVQSPFKKYFRSLLTQITCISPAVPSHTEGRLAIVTNAGRDAVDADVPITNGA